jgi:hypothetical protein
MDLELDTGGGVRFNQCEIKIVRRLFKASIRPDVANLEPYDEQSCCAASFLVIHDYMGAAWDREHVVPPVLPQRTGETASFPLVDHLCRNGILCFRGSHFGTTLASGIRGSFRVTNQLVEPLDDSVL